jgi:hypothetical protein
MTQNIIIRRYKKNDVDFCIKRIEQYLENPMYGNTHYKGLDFSKEKMYKHLTNHLFNDDFFCNLIIADEEIVGGLCAYIASPIFSEDCFAYDQLLYVVPTFKHRTATIRLIQSYIQWAQERKAKQCFLRTSTLYKEEGFTKLCQRLGFARFETGFAKDF